MQHFPSGRTLGGAVWGREVVKVGTGSVWAQSHENSQHLERKGF